MKTAAELADELARAVLDVRREGCLIVLIAFDGEQIAIRTNHNSAIDSVTLRTRLQQVVAAMPDGPTPQNPLPPAITSRGGSA